MVNTGKGDCHQDRRGADSVLVRESRTNFNPNLKLENQYCENLLKQIHFMNLEIDLLKRSQAEDRGGKAGQLYNDKQNYTTHLIDAKDKFGVLNQNLQKRQAVIEKEMFIQNQRNRQLLRQNEIVVEKGGQIREQMRNSTSNFEDKLEKLKHQMRVELDFVEQYENQIGHLSD